MQLDWCEPLKTGKIGESAVSPNRRFDCTRFFFFVFFSTKSLKTTSFWILILKKIEETKEKNRGQH
jgi:hypothetical protein